MNRGYLWMILIAAPIGIGISLFRGHLIWAAGVILLALMGCVRYYRARAKVRYYRARAKERDHTSGATHEPS